MDDASSDLPATPTVTSASEYTVVARRYRPQTFAELIGQEHVAQALSQAISAGRVGHAYLFTGARGVGKTSAARVLAKALNCVTGPTPTPCNACEVCRSVAAGDDVDVLEIDGASNRGIDEIRQLRQNVAMRPSRVRYKVYIIDEVHMLTKEAFNALLKTLEEPPEHVKFIFATTEPNKIPITILSRCQRFDFAGIESASIEKRLAQIAAAEGVEVEPEALAVLATRAAGSMRDSQSLLEQLLAVASERLTVQDVYQLLGIAPAERLVRLVDAIVDRQAAVALGELDEVLSGGADVGQLVDQLLGYFRDLMAIVVGCDRSLLKHVMPAQQEQAHTAAERLGVHTALAMIQVLDQTASRMRVSTHTRTLAEMAVVRLCHLDDLEDLAAAVAELREGTDGASSVGPRQLAVKKNDNPANNRPATAPPIAPQSAVTSTPAERPAVAASTPQEPVAPLAGSRVPVTAASSTLPTPAAEPALGREPVPRTAISESQLQAAWQQVAENLSGLLASYVEMATGVRIAEDGVVVVRFLPTDQPSQDFCAKPEQKTRLEQALANELGQPIGLRFEQAEGAAPGRQPPPAPKRASRRQLQSEVAERPFVARAVELFAAEPGKLRVVPPGQK